MACAGAMVLAACATSACGGGGLRVGLAYDVGGRGDKSFNDAAAAGLDRVKQTLPGIGQVRELAARDGESDNDRYDRLKLLCGADFEVVIAVGYLYAGTDPATGPLANAAKACPNTHFAIVDDARVTATNVAGLVFADEQGSYLVGVAAARTTTTGKVGFVGGCRNSLIGRFAAGFRAGVHEARPDATTTTRYLADDVQPCPGFADPDAAETQAKTLYDAGVDVVFHATGGSGEGVFRAAAAKPGRWAIGVDSDQYVTVGSPLNRIILTSMIKRVDTAVFEFVRSVTQDRPLVGEQRFDLASGGVGFATSGGHIDGIIPELEAYQKQIIDGSIIVPQS